MVAGSFSARPGEERWWQKKGNPLAESVWAIATSLEADQEYRKAKARSHLSLFEGRPVSGLYGVQGGMTSRHKTPELDYNLSRAACDTVHAEIAGRQKPMAKFQTSDADWRTKRRAKKLEKFCSAVLHQRQGMFLNAWELMESAFLDAAIWGMGVVKVFVADGKIHIERHFAHELYVDDIEAMYGAPQNLFHIHLMERDKAIWAFADDPDLKISNKRRKEIRNAIEASEEEDDGELGTSPRVAKTLKVVEAWRLQHASGKPGKHVFSIRNVLLHEEDWDRSEFPFVFMRWEQDRIGWHAKGLVEEGESIHREVNANASKMQERFKLCGSKRTYVEDDSVDMEAMQANDAENIIRVRKGAQMPVESNPKPIADAEMGWMNECFTKYFELTGVSQMRASARKEPGVTAGVAIRTLNDMQTARFALKAKGYENAYVSLAQQIIYCGREAKEAGDDMVVRYEEEIQWSSVTLPEDTFEITIAPSSSLPNDPAGRMQMTQELFSAGIIQVETFKQLLGWPDLEKEMNYQTAQTRWLEKLIDQILDEGELAYESPDGHIIDKPRAMMQVSQAYFDALYDDAPEENLSFLRQYMVELDHLIEEAQRAQAQAAADLATELHMAQAAIQGQPPMGPGNRPGVAAPPQEMPNVA